MEFGSEHRKKRWYVAVVGGIVGAGGLAAAGVVTIIAPPEGTSAAAEQTVSRPAAGDSGSKSKDDEGKDSKDDKGDKGKDGKVKKIGCDPDELIAALVRANADHGATLELEPKCTYTLTAFDGGPANDLVGEVSGLPEIVQRVKIDGNGATIVRAANAEPFRIFNVGVGGDLTLRDVTIKGGDARNTDLGGGALLVQEGGRATIEDGKLTLNRSDSFGGAITNLGITKVVGEDEKDGKKEDGKKEGGKKDGGKKGDGSEITNNSALEDGGAIANTGALTVERTRVSRNDAEDGGGIATFSGVAKVTKSEIDHNQADFAGAIFAEGPGGVTEVKESYVHDNTASEEGGAFFNDGSQFFVQRSKVVHNTAEEDGGGVVNFFGAFVAEKTKLNENKAVVGIAGGFGNTGEATLRDSEVNRNTAFGEDAFGGGIVNVDGGTVRLTNTDVIENASTEAPGGVFNEVENGVQVDDRSTIIKNRPTNCLGSPEDVPNCFG